MSGEGNENGIGHTDPDSGGEGTGSNGTPSIEELRAVQERQDAKLATKREEEARLAKEKLERQRKIQMSIAGRDILYGELKEIEERKRELGGEGLASRIKKIENTALELRDKEGALNNLRESLTSATERLKAIREIVKGREEGEIAEDVKTELEKAEKQCASLAGDIEQMEKKTKEIESLTVPEGTAEEFRNLLIRSAELGEKIVALEDIKEVRDKLFDEALTENVARKRIASILVEKMRGGYIPSEIRQLYVTNLTNIYLSNELRGLSDEDRAKALNGIACTIRNADPTVIDTTKILREHLANRELLPYYDMANTLIMFSGRYESYLNSPRMLGALKNRPGGNLQYDSRYVHEVEKIAKEELAKHADTYNYVLAASRATEDYGLLFHSRQVLSEVRDGLYGVVLSDRSPFVPSNITEQEAVDIGRAYRRYFSMMAEGVLEIIDKTLKTNNSLKERLTSELNELQNRLKRIEELKERYESLKSENEGRNRYEEETAIKRKIADLKEQRRKADELLNDANMFSRGRRKRDLENIQTQLDNAQKELETFNGVFAELDKANEDYNATIGEKSTLGNKVIEKESAIRSCDAEVASLTSAREKLLSKVAILERSQQQEGVESS